MWVDFYILSSFLISSMSVALPAPSSFDYKLLYCKSWNLILWCPQLWFLLFHIAFILQVSSVSKWILTSFTSGPEKIIIGILMGITLNVNYFQQHKQFDNINPIKQWTSFSHFVCLLLVSLMCYYCFCTLPQAMNYFLFIVPTRLPNSAGMIFQHVTSILVERISDDRLPFTAHSFSLNDWSISSPKAITHYCEDLG